MASELSADPEYLPPEAANSPFSVEAGNERLIRLPEVMARVGLRRTAIYQRMREGRFPKSRSLGPRCTVWVEAEINEWISSVVKRH